MGSWVSRDRHAKNVGHENPEINAGVDRQGLPLRLGLMAGYAPVVLADKASNAHRPVTEPVGLSTSRVVKIFMSGPV